MITRIYSNLEQYLEHSKALVIYGPRRVGKTTLLNNLVATTQLKYRFVTGDDIQVREVLGSQDIKYIQSWCEGYQLVIIDEAQRIPAIGFGLKIITDHVPNTYLIATGSASFDLMNKLGEPLTGRKKTLRLYPLSQKELLNTVISKSDLQSKVEEYLIYGSYPEVITAYDNLDKKKEVLYEIVGSYLLKDILELEQVKGSKVLLDLLRLLAHQVGNEVSLSELARSVLLDVKTVARYLDLFEKAFVLYNLRGFSRNLRSEITNKSKYYFYDNGIRNALISNFNMPSLRGDVGKLWENFMVIERIKQQEYNSIYSNNYFWRTWDQQKVDWIEEREGKLNAYEFKWNGMRNIRKPKRFLETYPNSNFILLNRDNYLDYIL